MGSDLLSKKGANTLPAYYDVSRATTTSSGAASESEHVRALTTTAQATVRIMGVYGACRSGTAGGAQLRVKTYATVGSGGTSQTPAKRNANSAAASSVWTNDASAITAGTTATTRLTIGLAQTGGMGGWVALEIDHALALLTGGGANGNMSLFSIANAASIAIDTTTEFQEN